MNALAQPATSVASAAVPPLLRTLVLCDLVDSTALTERLGDQRAADLFRKHDRLGHLTQHVDAAKAKDLTVQRNAAPAGILLDPNSKVARAYGAQTTPHMDTPTGKMNKIMRLRQYARAAKLTPCCGRARRGGR